MDQFGNDLRIAVFHGHNSKKCRPIKIGNIPPVQTSVRSGTNSTTVPVNDNCLVDPSIALTRNLNLALSRGVPLAASMTLYHCGYLSTSVMICQRTLVGAEIIDFASTRTTEISECGKWCYQNSRAHNQYDSAEDTQAWSLTRLVLMILDCCKVTQRLCREWFKIREAWQSRASLHNRVAISILDYFR